MATAVLLFIHIGPVARPTGLRTGGNGAFRACLSDRGGVAGIEFGLLAPMLIVLLFGMIDYGGLTYQLMEVQLAAHAGADYALHNGFNSSNIQTAAQNATPVTVTVTPSQMTACVVNGALSSTNQSTCTGGAAPGSYTVVTTTATFTPLIAWAAFAMPSNLTATATVRLS